MLIILIKNKHTGAAEYSDMKSEERGEHQQWANLCYLGIKLQLI